jgi:hypothetical protein
MLMVRFLFIAQTIDKGGVQEHQVIMAEHTKVACEEKKDAVIAETVKNSGVERERVDFGLIRCLPDTVKP